MSGYSKLGLAAIAFALRDAGLDRFDARRPIGIVAGSRLGCLSTDIDYFDTVLPENGGLASPALFAYTLANCFLGEAAIQFGLTGPGVVVTESRGGDGLESLRMALEGLELREFDAVLAGCCDFPVPPPAPGIEPPVPGALFFLLETGTERSEAGYGRLALSADGTVRRDGDPATGLVTLAQTCLAATPLCSGSRP
jgi:3-oxoacyl-[acyl-carrier-protein] synthase II